MKKSFLISLLVAMQLVALGFGDFNVDLDSGAGNSVSVTNPITANNGENIATVGGNILEIVSPKDGVSVDYSYITLKIKTVGLYRVSAKNESMADEYAEYLGYQIGGVKNDDYYFIYNVPLRKGENDINITVKLKDNLPEGGNIVEKFTSQSKIIKVNSTVEIMSRKAVKINSSLNKSYEPIKATLKTISTLDNIKRYYYDFEGDGKVDKKSKKDSVIKKYKDGSSTPMVTVETEEGVFFSSLLASTPPIAIEEMPKAKSVDILQGINVVDMQYWGDLYILTSNKVYIVNLDTLGQRIEFIKQVVDLGDVDNPQGLHVTRNDNKNNDIYIADTGNNRVIRFLEKNAYQKDPNYEIQYDFNQPVDVIASTKYREYPESLKVLDRGNNRVVVFKDKNMTSIFTGEGSLNGKLNNPINFFMGYLLDRDGILLRGIDTYRNDSREDSLGIHNISHGKLGKIVNSNIIASEEDKQLLVMFKAEDLEKRIKLDCSPTIAIPSGSGVLDKTYFACKEKAGVFSILPYSKPKGERAIDIAEKFGKAILAKDTFTMIRLAHYRSKTIKSLNLDFLGKILQQTIGYSVGYQDNNTASINALTTYKLKFRGKTYNTKVNFQLSIPTGQFFRTDRWIIYRVSLRPIKDKN